MVSTGAAHAAESKKSTQENIVKVISLLLKEDKKRLFDMVKKLNARQEFAAMAQVLLRELLPRFSPEELMDEFKKAGGGLKDMLIATEMYSGKHYTRVDRNLKRSYYVQFVLSQMTLLEDKKLDSKEEKPVERKRDKKSKRKKEESKRANLFAE